MLPRLLCAWELWSFSSSDLRYSFSASSGFPVSSSAWLNEAESEQLYYSLIPSCILGLRAGWVCDTKVERREKLKESRKILAYPYFRPLGQPRRARGDPLTGR